MSLQCIACPTQSHLMNAIQVKIELIHFSGINPILRMDLVAQGYRLSWTLVSLQYTQVVALSERVFDKWKFSYRLCYHQIFFCDIMQIDQHVWCMMVDPRQYVMEQCQCLVQTRVSWFSALPFLFPFYLRHWFFRSKILCKWINRECSN